MRRLGALIALLALGAAAYGQTFPEPRTIKINERVYVLLGPIQHAINRAYLEIEADSFEFQPRP
jgi:hypothetical protein